MKLKSGDVLKAAVSEVSVKVNKVMRAAVLEAQGKIMARTPVDTGRARANWNTTAGEPNTSTDEKARDYRAKQAAGANVLKGVDFYHEGKAYMANGLPYIEVLENGHSQQAPAGMVGLTLAEMKPVLEDFARKVHRE